VTTLNSIAESTMRNAETGLPAYPLRPATSNIRSLKSATNSATLPTMSSVKEIESALAKLTLEEKQAVRDWLEDLIEGQLEVSDEYKAKVQRAKQEIADGVYSRVRKPEAGR
jgi:hypothetical protein